MMKDPFEDLLREVYEAVVDLVQQLLEIPAAVVAPVRPSLLLLLAILTTVIAVFADEFNFFGWVAAPVCWSLYLIKRITVNPPSGTKGSEQGSTENLIKRDKKDEDDPNSRYFAIK